MMLKLMNLNVNLSAPVKNKHHKKLKQNQLRNLSNPKKSSRRERCNQRLAVKQRSKVSQPFTLVCAGLIALVPQPRPQPKLQRIQRQQRWKRWSFSLQVFF